MKSTEHIMLVAALHMVWSLFLLVAGAIVFVLLGLGGILEAEDGVTYVSVAVATLASSMLFVTAAAGFIGAFGLLKHRNWARFMVMVLSAIWLLKVPVGTALGVYSFYVLTRDEIADEFRQAHG